MFLFDYLSKGLAIMSAFRELRKLFRHVDALSEIMTFDDVHQLSQAYFNDDVPNGTVVELEGVLTQYAHIHHPGTYVPNLPSAPTFKRTLNQIRMESDKFEMFQPPVYKLPEMEVGGRRLKLAFIYPKDFVGFKYESTRQENGFVIETSNTPLITVPNSAKPLPILLPSEMDISNGALYKVKARVRNITDTHLNELVGQSPDYWAMFYSHTVDLNSIDHSSLCLVVDDSPTYARATNVEPTHFPMSLYIEGFLAAHAGDDLNMQDLVYKSVPWQPQLTPMMTGMVYMTNAGEAVISALVTTSNVRPVFRQPNLVGFYISTDMYQNRAEKTRELLDFVRRFDRNVQERSNRKVKFYSTFMSDAIFSTQLGPRMLNGPAVDLFLSKNPGYLDTIRWLQQK